MFNRKSNSHRTKTYTLASRTNQRTDQSLQESMFFATQIKLFFKNFPPTKKNKKFQRTVLTRTDTALNVECFGQSVCGLETVVLRTNSRAAANIRLKEIFKEGALTVKRTVVHLTNSSGYTNSRASNPPFLKLL